MELSAWLCLLRQKMLLKSALSWGLSSCLFTSSPPRTVPVGSHQIFCFLCVQPELSRADPTWLCPWDQGVQIQKGLHLTVLPRGQIWKQPTCPFSPMLSTKRFSERCMGPGGPGVVQVGRSWEDPMGLGQTGVIDTEKKATGVGGGHSLAVCRDSGGKRV